MGEARMKPQFDRGRHGGLYDRGAADNYYGRTANPHWYPQGTHKGEPIMNLDNNEIQEYMEGYVDNEALGDKKIW